MKGSKGGSGMGDLFLMCLGVVREVTWGEQEDIDKVFYAKGYEAEAHVEAQGCEAGDPVCLQALSTGEDWAGFFYQKLSCLVAKDPC